VKFFIIVLICGLAVAGCGDDDTVTTYDVGDFPWLSPNVPRPRVPENNPLTPEKIELGRHLFYDTQLSGNETQSCSSCHEPDLGFADGLARSVGSTGDVHPRSSMGLTNVAYSSTLNWASPSVGELEIQLLTPLFADDPVELGMPSQDELVRRLNADPDYPTMFAEAFPADADPVTVDNVANAIASFERRLTSASSPYDDYIAGDTSALTESERRGLDLFLSERTECFHCHGGFNFSDSVTHEGTAFTERAFHNNGLYNVGGSGLYPDGNGGLFEETGLLEDSGKFKAPTLRNIELTAPYMHDGSLATLDDVIDHYARGGTLTESGPNAGDGRDNPFKSEFIVGFQLTEQEREDLKAFLRALTDHDLIDDPAVRAPQP
jgi:cytochrome c peroxidase